MQQVISPTKFKSITIIQRKWVELNVEIGLINMKDLYPLKIILLPSKNFNSLTPKNTKSAPVKLFWFFSQLHYPFNCVQAPSN